MEYRAGIPLKLPLMHSALYPKLNANDSTAAVPAAAALRLVSLAPIACPFASARGSSARARFASSPPIVAFD
jgi:hypothetical protein